MPLTPQGVEIPKYPQPGRRIRIMTAAASADNMIKVIEKKGTALL